MPDLLLLPPGAGEPITREPRREVTIKAALEQLTVTESRYPSGERGPDRHVHWRHVDAFYVLTGEVDFVVGNEVQRAGPGSFLAAPPGARHGFSNPGPADLRVLNFHAPDAGFVSRLRN